MSNEKLDEIKKYLEYCIDNHTKSRSANLENNNWHDVHPEFDSPKEYEIYFKGCNNGSLIALDAIRRQFFMDGENK